MVFAMIFHGFSTVFHLKKGEQKTTAALPGPGEGGRLGPSQGSAAGTTQLGNSELIRNEGFHSFTVIFVGFNGI